MSWHLNSCYGHQEFPTMREALMGIRGGVPTLHSAGSWVGASVIRATREESRWVLEARTFHFRSSPTTRKVCQKWLDKLWDMPEVLWFVIKQTKGGRSRLLVWFSPTPFLLPKMSGVTSVEHKLLHLLCPNNPNLWPKVPIGEV